MRDDIELDSVERTKPKFANIRLNDPSIEDAPDELAGKSPQAVLVYYGESMISSYKK